MKNTTKIINRKVNYEYFILETYNAGIVLKGSEVKSIREGRVNLTDSYCYFNNGELFVKNLIVSESKIAFSHEPNREKKLLLKKRELIKLESKLDKGLSIVPYKIYSNDRTIFKVEICLVQGKKLYDKRESIKEKEIKRKLNNKDYE